MKNKKETMLDAFLRQSKIDKDDPIQQTDEGLPDPILGLRTKEEIAEGNRRVSEAIQQFGKSLDLQLNSSLRVPKKISKQDIEQKTVSHPNLVNYDHSLEIDRWSKIGGQGGKDIEMGDV